MIKRSDVVCVEAKCKNKCIQSGHSIPGRVFIPTIDAPLMVFYEPFSMFTPCTYGVLHIDTPYNARLFSESFSQMAGESSVGLWIKNDASILLHLWIRESRHQQCAFGSNDRLYFLYQLFGSLCIIIELFHGSMYTHNAAFSHSKLAHNLYYIITIILLMIYNHTQLFVNILP